MSRLPEHALPVDAIRIRIEPSEPRYYFITTACDFFNQEIQVVFGNGKVCFKAVPLSYVGHTYNPWRQGNGFRFTVARKHNIPVGEYPFDVDESNEDIKVIYLEDIKPLYERKQKDVTPAGYNTAQPRVS